MNKITLSLFFFFLLLLLNVVECWLTISDPQKKQVDPAKQRFAQLYLVDLAGSERVMKSGVVGTQLEEAVDPGIR